MESIQQYLGQELRWVQPSMTSMSYELQAPEIGTPLATMRWETMWAARAEGYTNDGMYYLDRRGLFNINVQVREQKEADPVAILKPHWNYNGTLTFTNGNRFEWKSTSMWQSEWKWESSEGGQLMNFRPHQTWKNMMKAEAVVLIDPAAADFPEMPVLALLGWYQMILQYFDASGAVAST